MRRTFGTGLAASLTAMALTVVATAAVPALAQTGLPPAAAAQQTRTGTVLKNRAPVAAQTLTVHLPRPKTFRLTPPAAGHNGGAQLLVVEDHRLPLVTITVSLKAGTLFDAADRPGVAEMTADLLTEGTTRRTALDIARETDRIGASLQADAGAERATVSISGPSDQLDALIDLLSDVLLHPSFAADRLQRVQFRAVQQREQQKANPQYLAGQMMRQALYGADTAYGRPEPTAAQIRAITADEIRDFYQRYYRNTPATLVGVAGDINASDVHRRLQAALASWAGAAGAAGAGASDASDAGAESQLAALPPGSFTPKEHTAVYLIDRPGSAQTVLAFANLGIRRTDPDYFPLLVANYILGGSANGRLFQRLREEKGYTYGAYSSLSTPKYPGVWVASASVRNAVTAPATSEFLKEIARIQAQPVSDAELKFAQRALVGQFALTLENPSAVLSRLLDVVDYGLPQDYWDTYPKRVDAVTPADVQRVAEKYLGSGRVQVIAVGERQLIEPAFAAVGPVTVRTPEQVLNPSSSPQ